MQQCVGQVPAVRTAVIQEELSVVHLEEQLAAVPQEELVAVLQVVPRGELAVALQAVLAAAQPVEEVLQAAVEATLCAIIGAHSFILCVFIIQVVSLPLASKDV